MANPRKPTPLDLESMSRAIGLVTAYELGNEDSKYGAFAQMTREASGEESLETIRSLSQFAWLMTRTLARTTGKTVPEVLAWYGERFAMTHAQMQED